MATVVTTAAKSTRVPTADKKTYYKAIGRRKTSRARVFLAPGNGDIIINKCALDDYFGRKTSRMLVKKPLEVTGLQDRFDIMVTVKGGGINGQAGAIQLGIARALVQFGIESDDAIDVEEMKRTLRASRLLTSDSRIVERKKVARKKARKRSQFSKR